MNSDVVAETEILPYDDWQAVIDRNEVFVMTPCVCKSMQASFKGDFSWEDDHEARYDDGVGHSFRINTSTARGPRSSANVTPTAAFCSEPCARWTAWATQCSP